MQQAPPARHDGRASFGDALLHQGQAPPEHLKATLLVEAFVLVRVTAHPALALTARETTVSFFFRSARRLSFTGTRPIATRSARSAR
jgi:hypothetical protein